MPNAASISFLVIALVLTVIAYYDALQTRHSLLRTYPLLSRLRWVFEAERDKIKQYFIESDLDGTPINREKRSVAYQRSKLQIETVPFGTQHNVYDENYEFLPHSLFPKDHHLVKGEKVTFGSDRCTQPYDTSLINISAMSFGSLSKTAIMALNQGAKEGNFAHNTGEGGISPYHLQGGDLIFQIGTGYFGAGKTNDKGVRVFDRKIFSENAQRPEVKMVEIKLSQGAKPGHGGILPAKKNTEEIAKIRSVEPFTRVDSPPGHSAFSDFYGMVDFIEEVRQCAQGKPVGIKLCVGQEEEVEEMIKTFAELNNYPDFIAVDGAEGGTGSAPLEFTNYVGMPILQSLPFVVSLLEKYNLKDKIKIMAAGKAVDAFDVFKLLSLGANTVYMARSFMLSLGCIQARECNKDSCPVGVATQNPNLSKALVVERKFIRVKNYHSKTILALKELVAAVGLENINQIKKEHIIKKSKAKKEQVVY
jgi:glutamate synthase domain-containing protein 2